MKNNYTEEQKEKVCDLVYKWMVENNCYSAEHASQDDDCTINAIDLVCELAEIVGIPYDED
jgi:uncharacterized protein YeaC (DUF1315 family)